jgi:DNA-binding XRE family transcriptional regulator
MVETFQSFRITDPVITSPAPPYGVSRPGDTSSGDLCRAPQQLRQLGDVGGDAPGLVAGEQRCANGCGKMLDFRAGTKTPMSNQHLPSGIAILRETTGRLVLFINGQRVNVRRGQAQLALLACLLDNLGRAVPHRRLFTVIGRKSANWSARHLLRQYMSMLRELLLANKAPVVIATVHDVGYALCEIAENPRHTSNNGVSRLAKTVRHWRIAAGLTQTAVAKQSGVNRSYLSHLESGRRNPTLATLQRLAKILNVAPGYFL